MRNSKSLFKTGIALFILGVFLYFVMQSDFMKNHMGSDMSTSVEMVDTEIVDTATDACDGSAEAFGEQTDMPQDADPV